MATKKRLSDKTTRDAIYLGCLILEQPATGYRFSVDSLLLTEFAGQGRPASRAVDLGAGSGIVGLSLLAAGAAEHVVAVEVQPRLAELALKNAELNNLGASFSMIPLDIRSLGEVIDRGSADLVVINPPFWPAHKGRLPEDEECRIACHEMLCPLSDWIEVSAYLLHPRRGRLNMIFPARRTDDLVLALNRFGLSATRIKFVHPRSDRRAELVLLEARPGRPGRVEIEPPSILKDDKGNDTAEAAVLVSGRFSAKLRARLGDAEQIA